MKISRRGVIACAACALGLSHAYASAADREQWDVFKSRFLSPEGRVIDTGNANVSHTEGQGWGLLFAVGFDDEAAFRTILNWTMQTLRRPHDALHAWRYVPGVQNQVPDQNNATDGDLFIAMALSQAARRWDRSSYADSSAAIGADIVRLLMRTVAGFTVLLPGLQGFEFPRGVVVNPSYIVFPAMRELAETTHSPAWTRLNQDGLSLILGGRFGRWMLPPDWLLINGKTGVLEPAPGWPPRFSYDAIRVPLYLSWSRQMPVALEEQFHAYWSQNGGTFPAWTNLQTNEAAIYAAPSGMRAVGLMAEASSGSGEPGPDFPTVASATDYYSAALTLLARLGWQQSR